MRDGSKVLTHCACCAAERAWAKRTWRGSRSWSRCDCIRSARVLIACRSGMPATPAAAPKRALSSSLGARRSSSSCLLCVCSADSLGDADARSAADAARWRAADPDDAIRTRHPRHAWCVARASLFIAWLALLTAVSHDFRCSVFVSWHPAAPVWPRWCVHSLLQCAALVADSACVRPCRCPDAWCARNPAAALPWSVSSHFACGVLTCCSLAQAWLCLRSRAACPRLRSPVCASSPFAQPRTDLALRALRTGAGFPPPPPGR